MTEEIQDRIQQGIELMAAQRYEAARDAFIGVLKLDKGNYEAHFNLANAYVNLGEVDAGVDEFKKALLAREGSDEALYGLACALFLGGHNAEAVREFNRCEQRGRATTEMYQILQAIFVDAGDYVQAVRYANKAIQLEPLNAQLYLDKAQILLLREQPREAVSCLREVEDLLPDSAEPYIVEAQILVQSKDGDAALASIDRAVGRFPDDPTLHLTRARVLNELERYVEALPELDRAEGLAGGSDALLHDIAFQRAIALAGSKDLDASIAELERAAELGDASDETLFLLITECGGTRRFEEAERYADRVLTGEQDVDARTRAAAVYWKAASMKELGREDEAQAAFREAVGVLRRITISNPGLVDGYAYRLMCHKELGEYDRALDLADHIIGLSPDNAAGYAFKADVLEAQGNGDEARTLREKAASLGPQVNTKR